VSTRGARALGGGTLKREQRGEAPARWVLYYSDSQGRRRREALSTDKRVAEQIRTDRIRQRDLELAGLGPVAGQESRLSVIAALYVEDLASRAVVRHHAQVRTRLEKLAVALGDPRVRDLAPHAVARLRAAHLAQGASHRTANLLTDSLRACLTWAVSMQLIAVNPLATLRALPSRKVQKRRVRRALTEDEITRFLAAAEADDAEQAGRLSATRTISRASKGVQWALRVRGMRIPQAPLWRAFVETGARYGELVALTWADVELDARAVHLRHETTKSGRPRSIPLTNALARALVTLQAEQVRVLGRLGERVFLSPDGAVWTWATNNAGRIFQRLMERAGIERRGADGRTVDIHALRHTLASRLARNGVGLVQAQKLLGHSDPKLTAQVYSHLEVEDLRGAIETLNPGKLAGAKRTKKGA